MNIYYKITDANSIVYLTGGIYLIKYLIPLLKGVCTKSRAVRIYDDVEHMEFIVPLSCEEVDNIIKKYEYLL